MALSLDLFQEQFGVVADLEDGKQESEEQLEEEEQKRRQLYRALLRVVQEELTPCQKRVVCLYFFEKKNIPAIAEELSVNKSTVSRTLKRARDNLTKYLRYYQIR